MKKLVALFLALTLLCSCGIVFAEQAELPEGYPEIVIDPATGEPVDLGGIEITLYDYWSGDNPRAEEPTEEQQAQYDFQDWFMKTYNFTMTQKQGSDWGGQAQEIINFVGTPDGSYRLYILPPDFVGTPMGNNCFAAWEDFDFSADKWLTSTINFMTKVGQVYGVATGNSEPRGCLFFNKRVLENAGIEWDSIYDKQAEGTWTWDVFEEMLQKIQKDEDNDGTIDIWGMTGSNVDMYILSVFGNNGDFFCFDDNGKLVISAGSENTLEGLTWSKNIFDTYFYKQPDGGQWDYYKEAWKQSFCGFYVYHTYGGFNDNSEMADMKDEWGCVAFPKGPKGDKYINVVSDNVTIIPNVYTSDEVKKIMFAYDLWSTATPGYDDEDGWIGNKYNFTDERAVDETYAMLREPDHCLSNACLFIGSVNDILGNGYLWELANKTPAELLEAKTPAWQGLLDIFNGDAVAAPAEEEAPAAEEEAPAAE